MAAQARIIIKGEDQLKTPLKQAQQELTGFESVANKVGDTLKKAFTVAAIIKGIQELSKAVAECVNEFKEQIEVDTRLNAVIKATGQQYKYTTKDIKNYAQALQEQTRFGDDVIEQSAQLLVATQKFSKEGLERTLELSADLAEAMGTDLTSATSTLSKALIEPGEGLNRLKTIGVSFTDTEEDMIKALREAGNELGAQQYILDKVEAAYGGVAKSVGSLDTSKLDQIKKVWGDLKEDIGKGFVTLFGGVFDWIYKTLSALQRWTSQIVEKQNFNNYMHSGDVQGLADNFTQEFLEKELDKVSAEYNHAIIELSTEYVSYFNKLWAQEQISIGDFIRMSYDEQTEALNKILGPGQEGIMLAIRDIADGTYQYLLLQDAIKKQQDDIFKAEQFAMAKQAEETATATANAAKSAVDTALSEFGKLSETFKIKELDDNIAQIVELLERDDLGAFNRTVLEEALMSLRLQRYAYDTNPVKTGFQFSLNGIDPFGLNSITNLMSPANLLKTGLNAGILADKIFESNKFWEGLESTLNKYGSQSESYQEYLLEQEIDKVRTLLTSAFLDESSPVFTYMSEILDSLELQLAQMKKSDKGSSGSGGVKGQGALGRMSGEIQNFINAADAVWEDFKGQIGEAGDLINRLGTNMAQFGPLLGAIVTALHYVIEGLVEELGDIIGEFVQWGLEPLREFGRMIGQILLPIFKEIMPSVVATGKVLMNLFQSLARLLAPIVQILMRVIGPVLTALADVLVVIVGTISWAIDWIAYCITWVLNKISFGWIAQTARPADYQSYIDGMLQIPGEGYDSLSSSGSVGTTNASYSGGTVIHLNVYQQGVVCGDNGILEFATMIKNELADAQYLGR